MFHGPTGQSFDGVVGSKAAMHYTQVENNAQRRNREARVASAKRIEEHRKNPKPKVAEKNYNEIARELGKVKGFNRSMYPGWELEQASTMGHVRYQNIENQ